MNTTELKALADRCICRPARRGIADIMVAGKGLKFLAAQLEDAQGEIRALRATEAGLRERLAALEKAISDAEPVAWVNKGQIKSAEISRERGGPYDSHMWNECPTAFFQEPLYTLNGIKP